MLDVHIKAIKMKLCCKIVGY